MASKNPRPSSFSFEILVSSSAPINSRVPLSDSRCFIFLSRLCGSVLRRMLAESEERVMGAHCSEDLYRSPMYSFGSSQDFRFSKHVHDNVHGNIYLDPVIDIYASLLLFALFFLSPFFSFENDDSRIILRWRILLTFIFR